MYRAKATRAANRTSTCVKAPLKSTTMNADYVISNQYSLHEQSGLTRHCENSKYQFGAVLPDESHESSSEK